MKLIAEWLYPDPCIKDGMDKRAMEGERLEALRKAIISARDIDMRGIMEAGMTVLKGLDLAKTILLETEDWHGQVKSFSFMTPLGRVLIGGVEGDLHKSPAALIIDLGGNDLYRGETASGTDGRCSVLLDLKGDDVYMGGDRTQGVW